MMGTLGAWCSISGNHYNVVNLEVQGVAGGGLTLAFTLSKDGGLTIEKQIRKTSVWG